MNTVIMAGYLSRKGRRVKLAWERILLVSKFHCKDPRLILIPLPARKAYLVTFLTYDPFFIAQRRKFIFYRKFQLHMCWQSIEVCIERFNNTADFWVVSSPFKCFIDNIDHIKTLRFHLSDASLYCPLVLCRSENCERSRRRFKGPLVVSILESSVVTWPLRRCLFFFYYSIFFYVRTTASIFILNTIMSPFASRLLTVRRD